MVLVAAGGNSNVEPVMYPAQIPGVKAIVAVTTSDVKASFSNYGYKAYVSAPGYGRESRIPITRSLMSPALRTHRRSPPPKLRWSLMRISKCFRARPPRT